MTKTVHGWRASPKTISITFSDGSPVVVAVDHPSFARILAKLQIGDFDNLWELCQPAEGIRSYFNGKIEIKQGGIFYQDEALDSAIVPTVLGMIQHGADPKHLLRFLLLLQKNPSMHSRDQLYNFVTKNGLTIYSGEPVEVTHTQSLGGQWTKLDEPAQVNAQGWIVLYKGVNQDLTDGYSGKFNNTPGTQLTMPRGSVDDNQSAHCSRGFHAGSHEYVKSFGDRKLFVLINPRDVVSVPNDCFTKLRTCSYIVLEETDKNKFEAIIGETYNGHSLFDVSFTLDGEYDSTSIEADSLEAATEEFELAFVYDEILSVVKVRG